MKLARTPLAPVIGLALLLAGCQATTTPPSSPSGLAGPSMSIGPSSAPSSGASGDPSAVRPIVLTTDMGMDDLLAVYMLLREPSVDILAITVDGTGLVHCGPGLRNLRRILVAFGREEIPFACGRDDAGPDGIPFPEEWRASSDNLYSIVLPPVVGTEFPPPGEVLLAEAIAGSSRPVTIVALGPWTTLQDLFAASPGTLANVAGIHAMAGAIDVPGNMDLASIKPGNGVEWNVGADPDSVADVLALDIPVTLVPLDATNDVPVPPTILADLDADHAAAGADIAFETYARSPYLATEGNDWWDSAAVAAFIDPTLMTWEDAPVTINERGRISRDPVGRAARFATGADTARTQAAVLAGLRRGAPRPVAFATTGTVTVTWDGTVCTAASPDPVNAGLTRVTLHNTSAAAAGLFAAGVLPPKTWAGALAWMTQADFSNPSLEVPAWIVQPGGEGPITGPGEEATTLVELPAGTVGFVCATGEWPDVVLEDGGSITVGA